MGVAVDPGQGTKSHIPQLKDPAWHSRYPRSRVLQLKKEHSRPAAQKVNSWATQANEFESVPWKNCRMLN